MSHKKLAFLPTVKLNYYYVRGDDYEYTDNLDIATGVSVYLRKDYLNGACDSNGATFDTCNECNFSDEDYTLDTLYEQAQEYAQELARSNQCEIEEY